MNKKTEHIDITTDIGYYQDMEKGFYSTKQAAERLGLSPDHVKLLARKGLIKAEKLGHDWLVLELTYTRRRKPKGGKK